MKPIDKLEFQGDLWADIENLVDKLNQLISSHNELIKIINKIKE